MLSLQSATRTITRAAPRRFATTAPPPRPGPGTPPSKGPKNTTLYVGAAAVALGGLYYYYAVFDPRSRADAERLKRKSHELGDTVKDSAHNKLRQGQGKVDEYRASGKEKLEKTRQEVEQAKDDTKTRASEIQKDVRSTVSEYGHDAQRKLDEYKASASNALVDARDDTEKKFEEAKAAGSSWFNWGSGKADDAREGGVEKVKEGAENVKQKADKYS